MHLGTILTSILSLAALALSIEGKINCCPIQVVLTDIYLAVETSDTEVVATAAFPETNAFNCLFISPEM